MATVPARCHRASAYTGQAARLRVWFTDHKSLNKLSTFLLLLVVEQFKQFIELFRREMIDASVQSQTYIRRKHPTNDINLGIVSLIHGRYLQAQRGLNLESEGRGGGGGSLLRSTTTGQWQH